VYANPRAQVYFHLPDAYHGINFVRQAERYYQPHVSESGQNYPVRGRASYLVQPESASAHAFWLQVELLNTPPGVENQRLLRVSDVTEEMSSYHDMSQIHSLVAHKLRTPASNLYSSLYLLDASMDTVSESEVKSLVKTAWRGAERLMESVLDILKYIDAPISLADGKPVSVGEIDHMVAEAGRTLELKALTISIPEPVAKCKLSISAKAMDLIVYEIMENSKKFHPSQTPCVQVFAEAYGEKHVELRFVDDGQTLTAEQLIRARQPYSQGEKWFTGEVPGMGLGIPLVFALVWQSGGEMRIENRGDQVGICVRIILPVLSPQ
jgi:K+-sensing histidine kinase KdpD